MKTLKTLTVASAALFSASVFAQDLSQTVSLELEARPAEEVVEVLSQEAGIALRVEDDSADAILTVAVTDVTVEELMARIAEATQSTWQRAGGGFRLTPDRQAVRAEEAELLRARFNQIQESLQTLQQVLEPSEPEENTEEENEGPNPAMAMGMMGMGGMMGGEAGRVLLAELSQNIDARLIAGLGEGERLVWSTNPTPLQRRLSARNIGELVDALIPAHNQQVQEWQEMQEELATNPEMSQFAGMFNTFSEFMPSPEPIETPPDKVLLIAEREEASFGALTLKMKLLDVQGRALTETSFPLIANFDTAFFEEMAAQMGGEEATEDNEEAELDPTPIEYDEATLELAEFFNLSNMAEMAANVNRAMSPELKQVMLRPDVHDPLSFGVGDGLISWAKAKDVDIVANVPDGILAGAFGFVNIDPEATVGEFRQQLLANDTLVVVEEGGWTVVKPVFFSEASRTRVDREALAGILRDADRNVVPSLDAIAGYALRNPEPNQTPLAMPYFMMFAPQIAQGQWLNVNDWDSLRLYGALNGGQRDTLKRGGSVPLNSLSRTARAVVENMVYGANPQLQAGNPDEFPPQEDYITQSIRNSMAMFGGARGSAEPTEALPNGLAGGYITGQTKTVPFGVPVTEDGEPNTRYGPLSPTELALFEMMSEDATGMMSQFMPELETMLLGERQVIRYSVALTPALAVRGELTDHAIGSNRATASFGDLPAGFRAAIEQEVAQLADSPFAQMMQMMPGMMTPPIEQP